MTWDFWLIELSAYAFFILALMGGFKESVRWGMTVLAAGAFGLAIELLFVHLAGGYEYGEFALMVAGAPLWVACGWAFIIYYSMRAAEGLPIAEWSRPFAAAVMATGLDLGLDPVAEGAGWWHWKREHAEFFGVSYDNFVGWLVIVGCYAGFNLLLVRLLGEDKKWKQITFPLLAIPASVVVVGLTQFLWEALYKIMGEGPVFLALYLLFLALALGSSRRGQNPRLTPQSEMPVFFNLLFIAVAGGTGILEAHPELYGAFALTATSSLFWFTMPNKGPVR